MYKVAVDLGIRWSSTQVTSRAPAELEGTLVTCVCNSPSRDIAGSGSEVLIFGARDANGDVILPTPRSDVPFGGPVF